VTGKEVAEFMLAGLPQGHYMFIDLLAKFHVHFVLMGDGNAKNEEKVLYKAIAVAKANGLMRKSEVLKGYERL
jgi:hypothetical protein